jgi:hypothetical protein
LVFIEFSFLVSELLCVLVFRAAACVSFDHFDMFQQSLL